MTVPFGDGVTVMLALLPVLFRGNDNISIRDRVKFIRLFHEFHRVVGQRLLVGASEAGLCISVYVGLKSSTSSAYYRQVLAGTGLAFSELVVPQCVWVSSLKLPEFLQTAY